MDHLNLEDVILFRSTSNESDVFDNTETQDVPEK